MDALAPGDLIELALDPDDEATYTQANEEIFRQSDALASADEERLALVVWNGESRGQGDVTEAFVNGSKQRNWPTCVFRPR